MRFHALLPLAVLALSSVSAHPGGGDHHEDHSGLREYIDSARADLSACSSAEHIQAFEDASFERRTKWLESLRATRGLHRRDYNTVLKTDHKSKLTGITPNTPASTLFADTVACILEPKVTEGPYWVNGEVIRTDVRENQGGLDLYLDVQFVDIKTCKPATGFYVDFWHANSTGVYSGVVANGNGNSRDTANKNRNYHRGIYPVDSDGVVQFITKYPGHYAGRTNHIHILTSKSGTLHNNNTFLVSSATHIGQLFFDQSLTTQVETLAPYKTNTQALTTNANDGIFKESAGNNFDPVVNYVFLGDTVANGIFSWIRVGIDTSKSYSAKAANTYNGQASATIMQQNN